jgi:putative membrane protein
MQNKWHRCSPVSILYFLFTQLKGLLNLWPMFAAFVVSENLRQFFHPLAILGLLVLIVVSAGLSYWFFRFRYDNDKIELRTGVFNKKKLLLSFDRVQEINLQQSIYFRVFNLWTLGLESAGSKKQEITVPGVPEILAHDVRSLYLEVRKQEQKAESHHAEPENRQKTDKVFLVMDLPDLVRFGLIHNTLIYIAAVVGPLIGQSEAVNNLIANWLESSFLGVFVKDYAANHSTLAVVLLVVLIFAGVLALLYVVSVLIAIVRFWGYTLYTDIERYQYNAGLLSRVSKGFKLHKLQGVQLKQNIIARLLRRYSMVLRQTNERANPQEGNVAGFLIPVLDAQQADALKDQLGVEQAPWQWTMRARMLWACLIWGSALAAIGFFVLRAADLNPYWALLAYPPMAAIQYRLWRSNRFYLSDNWLAIRSGFLGYSITYVPLSKIQKLRLGYGPILRAHGAARLYIYTGSSVLNIGFAPLTVLERLRDEALAKVSIHRGRWM